MRLFVIRFAALFEGTEEHGGSRGANVVRESGHLS